MAQEEVLVRRLDPTVLPAHEDARDLGVSEHVAVAKSGGVGVGRMDQGWVGCIKKPNAAATGLRLSPFLYQLQG